MSKRDYYEVLEVSVTATSDEIKRAYRIQARRYHPDLNPDNEEAETLFKEINEAFEILKDPEKRAAYDQFGHDAFAGGGAGRGPAGFEDMFGGGLGDFFDQMFGGGQRRQRTRGDDVQIQVTISLQEAFEGVEKTVSIHSPVHCETCHGTGSKSDSKPETCPKCHGRGVVRTQNGMFITERPCPTCAGTGSIVNDPCEKCAGNGIFEGKRDIKIEIPAGVEDGSRMRVPGEGNPGLHGLPNGDLHVLISVAADKRFERTGEDLHSVLSVPMSVAALGGSADIEGIEGNTVSVTIPAGSQTGDVIKIRNEGFSIYNTKLRGKLHVHVKVVIPHKLTARQKELLKEFQAEEDSKSEGLLHRVKDSFNKKK